MLDLSNINNIVENEAADKKIAKLRAEQEAVRREIEKAEREIAQGENKIKRLKSGLSKAERNTRTHRLTQRGAILEQFIPDAKTLTNDEIIAVLTKVFREAN
jgi:predicted  nucleic acid-binding Zn-ribbon protein